jgi:hypothetical protein
MFDDKIAAGDRKCDGTLGALQHQTPEGNLDRAAPRLIAQSGMCRSKSKTVHRARGRNTVAHISWTP